MIKIIKGIQIEREEVKLLLFVDYIIYPYNILKILINTFSKLGGYRINIQNSTASQYTPAMNEGGKKKHFRHNSTPEIKCSEMNRSVQ